MYDRIMNFSESLARVERNGKYGYINKNGTEVVPCEYDDVIYYPSENIITATKNKVPYLITLK